MDEFNQTEWNSNEATLRRVDAYIRNACLSHFIGDYSSYYKHLRNLRKEIIVKMKEKEREKEKELFREAKKNFALYETNRNNKLINNRFESSLNDYEDYLRYVANRKGMLLKDGQDNRGL